MTAYLVAGTQSEGTKQNFVVLVKMSQLKRTQDKEGVCVYACVLWKGEGR